MRSVYRVGILALGFGVLSCLALAAGDAKKDAKDDKGPFKDLKYRSIGPAAGGRVSQACGVPGDPFTFYVASAAGGVWKLTDAGLTWKSIFDDQPTSSIGSIAIAPSDPSVIYVGSGEANIRGNVMAGAGIFKSTNGGKTWNHVWKQKGQIGRMLAHPTNPDIAYAAVFGQAFSANPERGVYRTTDGGKSWKQVLKKDADSGAIDVCFDPSNPRILFASLWQARRFPWGFASGGPGSGLYRSDDAGETWTEIKHDADDEDKSLPPGPWGRVGIAIAPGDSSRIYVLIEAEKGGLYRSDDGGEKWELVNAGHYLRQRPWYFSSITVDPTNPDVLWCPTVRLLKSIDGGKTFKNVKGPHHPDHHDLWIDPKNPRRIIESNDGGVDISTNGGETWSAPPLPIAQFYHISVDTSVPYRVMGNMQDQGTASGPSNSLASSGISLSDWYTVGGGETGFSIADPSDPNVVYSGEYGGIVTRYDHRTRQARNISIYPTNNSGQGAVEQRYRFQWTAPILISPHNPKVLYHAANVLFKTSDAGRTWQKISPDLTRNDPAKQQFSGGPITGDNTTAEYYCTIFAIAESPKQAGVLWAGSDDGRVHVSRDGGGSWTEVTKNLNGLPEWATIVCIETSPHDAGTAFLIADAHRLGDDKPYLWKTKDFGATWARLTDKLPQDDYLRVVREDPALRGMLYVGSEHGVSYSRDEGFTWEKWKLNLPTCAVSDLIVKDNDLVVGTNGRSVWIFDDLAVLRQWSPKVTEGTHLFTPQPAVRWRYAGENYVGEDRLPGENPPKGALIQYRLDRKPKEEITLGIFDAKNNLVQNYSSKKQEGDDEEDPDVPWSVYKPTVLAKHVGVNRVTWDLAYSGPTVIPDAKNDAGTPHRGPWAAPGTYTLKLTVDGKTQTSSVEVRLDPRVKLAAKDLAEQHDFAMKLREDVTLLSKTVISLRLVRKQLGILQEVIGEEAKDAALVKQAKALEGKLDRLEEKLHNPKAEVSYDILAMKGGAKLYSQQAYLYEIVKDGDGPITQGMREVYEDQRREWQRLSKEWQEVVADVQRFNAAVKAAGVPAIGVK